MVLEEDIPSAPSEHADRPLAQLLVELAGVDDALQRLERSASVLRECTDAEISCRRAAESLMQEHSNWRASVTRESAEGELGLERVNKIVAAISAADEHVENLLDRYVECALPVKAVEDALSAEVTLSQTQRDALVQQLPAEFGGRHKLLQKRARPPFVSGLCQGRCTGCNVQLPTLLAQEVQRSGAAFCPGCKRILCARVTNASKLAPETAAPPVAPSRVRGNQRRRG